MERSVEDYGESRIVDMKVKRNCRQCDQPLRKRFLDTMHESFDSSMKSLGEREVESAESRNEFNLLLHIGILVGSMKHNVERNPLICLVGRIGRKPFSQMEIKIVVTTKIRLGETLSLDTCQEICCGNGTGRLFHRLDVRVGTNCQDIPGQLAKQKDASILFTRIRHCRHKDRLGCARLDDSHVDILVLSQCFHIEKTSFVQVDVTKKFMKLLHFERSKKNFRETFLSCEKDFAISFSRGNKLVSS